MQYKYCCSIFIIHRFSKYPEDCALEAAFNNDASFESSSCPAFSPYLCCNQILHVTTELATKKETIL
jgi:hypothetical protein